MPKPSCSSWLPSTLVVELPCRETRHGRRRWPETIAEKRNHEETKGTKRVRSGITVSQVPSSATSSNRSQRSIITTAAQKELT